MDTIAEYSVSEMIAMNARSVVYRGQSNKTGQAVILKTLSSDLPNRDDLGRLHYSFSLMLELAMPGLVEPISLIEHDNRPVQVLVDEGGVSLADLLEEGPLSPRLALRLFIQLAEILDVLHQQKQIVHRDIKPSNLIIQTDTWTLQLGDFEFASRLSHETLEAAEETNIQGTLSYIAPEQTGRMNRSVDHRSDLYALGVSLYEVLVGELPFHTQELSELVHAHIALPAPQAHARRGSIPIQLSKIITKLMAKMPEDRYQSARGLAHDLVQCEEQLALFGGIDLFPLGEQDTSPHFHISEKLYGREREQNTVKNLFASSKTGATNMLLVSGFSGIGKTSLVQELQAPIVEAHGRFLTGKYDQLTNAPYSGIGQALSQLVRHLLSEEGVLLGVRRRQILEAIGEQGQIIIDLIPELEMLIGPQSQVAPLPPLQANGRFQQLLTRFMRLFLTPDQPIVFFLDDLQWADANSLQLLKAWMADPHINSLFIIGSYRSNEVSVAHPLHEMATHCREHMQGRFHELALFPLHPADVRQLVADTLHLPTEEVEELSSFLLDKTKGNPYFIERLLLTLHEQQALFLSPETGRWTWDPERTTSLDLTDDISELMAAGIADLPPDTQEVLQAAASIGNQFDTRWLAKLLSRNMASIVQALLPAVQEQLLFPRSDAYRWAHFFQDTQDNERALVYRFAHDRVQEAAYSLLDDSKRPSLHKQLGYMMLESIKENEPSDALFEVVNQFNAGQSCIDKTNATETALFLRLNKRAGKRALEAAAWQAAFGYFKAGHTVLTDADWETNQASTYDFVLAFAEAALMAGEHEQCASLEDTLLSHCTNDRERAKVYQLRINRAAVTSQHDLMGEAALDALALFLPTFPQNDEEWQTATGEEFAAIAEVLKDKPISSFANAPKVQDEDALLELDVMSQIAPISMAIPHITALTLTRFARLGLIHGQSPSTSVGYAYYAALQAIMGDYDTADAFGQLALNINEQLQAHSVRPPIDHMYGSFVAAFKHPYDECIKHCQRSIIGGLEYGVFQSGAWGAMNEAALHITKGTDLLALSKRIDDLAQLSFQSFSYKDIGVFLSGCLHVVYNLSGQTDDQQALAKEWTEESCMEALAHYPMAQGMLYQLRAQASLHMGNYAQVLEETKHAQTGISMLPCSFLFPEYFLFESIALLALSDTFSEEEWQTHRQTIEETRQKMQHWASFCPANLEAKTLLLDAMWEAYAAKSTEATERFEEAIASAQTHALVHIEALALELAARYYFGKGQERMARGYLYDARFAYVRWGAQEKARQLDNEFTILQTATARPHQSTASTTIFNVDIQTIQQASTAMSREIVLDDLLRRLMEIVLKTAGAQRGCLFLHRDGELRLDIESEIDTATNDVMMGFSLEKAQVAQSIIRYVERAKETILLGHAAEDEQFSQDPYILTQQTRSLLCLPLTNQNKLVGVLYLENNSTTNAFTLSTCGTLEVLATQAAISIENAILYNHLEAKVEERTRELKQTYNQLEHKHVQLQHTQAQLVQSEKLAGLGTLVAGIAHELNNPANFNLLGAQNIKRRIEELHAFLLELLGEDADEEIVEMFRNKFEPIVSNVDAVIGGAERIKTIVHDLRVFSRLDEADFKRADVIDGLRATLALFSATYREDMKMDINLSEPFTIDCWPAQLNQTFMNIINNAHYAILDRKEKEGGDYKGSLRVYTEKKVKKDKHWFVIYFEDTGCGMSEETKNRVFEPFFTTREVGRGTGLGMATAIGVVTKHGGSITIDSKEGVGTTVSVELPDRTK